MKLNTQQILGIETSHLETFDDNHKLVKAAKNAFLKMQKAAANDGIDIQICSSFRSFERQLSIWNKKWNCDLPLYKLDGTQHDCALLSEEEKLHAILLWSALPGASRHHWGTDFDVFDKKSVEKSHQAFNLIPTEYQQGGPCYKLSCWLQENAQDFDFFFPYAHYVGGVAEEPWHMSYFPIASVVEESFDIEALRKCLIESPLHGKKTVLSKLAILLERYTKNKGLK